jgi:hypothetical protein
VFIFCYNLLALHFFIRQFTFMTGFCIAFYAVFSGPYKFNARDRFPCHPGSVEGRFHSISF